MGQSLSAPRLLLLDEPSVGVDPLSRRELWRMVYDLVGQGIGIVWSTAYLDEAERCAAVWLLNGGQLLYDGPPRQLTSRVEGRTFLVQRAGENRRTVLAEALKRPEVLDGIIQGSNIRLILQPKANPPDAAALRSEGIEIIAAPPRFEDAFVDLLRTTEPRTQGSGVSGWSAAYSAALRARLSQTEEIVIEANELTKRFGDFTAVERISFHIGRGEIFGLLGPNGAGKSTTFKMMCGLLRPTCGSARVAGHDLYRPPSAARARLGYMAQKFSLYGDLSVRQNLNFFAGVYGLKGSRHREAASRVIDVLGLEPYLNRNAGELPLGYKQRLALACAVMHEPAVRFLDEPTSGVDPLSRREFWLHINAMIERGVTVMVTTHFLDEAEYCDRIGLVYRGRLIAEGSPDSLKDRASSDERPEPTLEDAFIALVEASQRQENEA